MKWLVTGASGHLGANLVRQLVADGREVRCLVMPGETTAALDGLEVETVVGDLRDRDALARAVAGVERIFHCAARISTLKGGEEELFACNVLGTRNLLSAAREAGVKRVVVTGSFSAVGHFPDRPSTERDPFNMFDNVMPYERSKAGVEHECLKAVAEGQDVVIATSCAILGPNDFVPSRMGRTLIDFAHGKLRAYIPGGFEFVAARDIVSGHLLAMDKGRAGQKYILSSGFVSVDELMAIFERVTGRARPRLKLPAPMMAAVAEVTHFVFTHFFPKVPQRLTPGAVRILRQNRKADISKARQELGFQPTSIEAAVQAAYDHFVERGLISGHAASKRRVRSSASDQPRRERVAR